MRIALVTSSYHPDIGGLERHVGVLAAGLVQRGALVEVYTHHSSETPSSTEEEGVQVHRYPAVAGSRVYPVSFRLLRDLSARASSYDIVHAHNYHSIAPVVAALARPSTLVVTPHYHASGHTALRRVMHVAYRPVIRWVLARAAAVVNVSTAEQSLMAERFPELRPRTTVVPNGVDVDKFEGALPFDGLGPTVLCVARLERYKQVDRAILALREVDARLVIVGLGPELVSLRETAKAAGLEQRVSFMGEISRQDLSRWMRTANVVVAMSKHEAFGLVVAEALAAGAQVVASSIPAHKEMTTGHATALRLVPVDASAANVAEAINRALRVGRHEESVSQWSESEMVDSVLEVYRAATEATIRRTRRRSSGLSGAL